MLAWMNREAFDGDAPHRPGVLLQPQPGQALAQGRGERPRPGGPRIYVDCDADTVLLKVKQVGGAACHEGYASCFFRKVDGGELRVSPSGSSTRSRSTRNDSD